MTRAADVMRLSEKQMTSWNPRDWFDTRYALTAAFFLCIVLVASGSSSAVASGNQNEFPTDGRAAMEYYESDPDEWLNGPVQYLLFGNEHEVWDDLTTTAQRAQFIRWFWTRRDANDRAQGNEAREKFYTLVGEANRRFRDFPRGWKSDRGRVYCILGRPNSMRRMTSAQLTYRSGPDFDVWGYFTLGQNRAFQVPGGEFRVYFIEERIGSFSVYDWSFGAAGMWNRGIRDAFEYTLEESIVDLRSVFEPKASIGDYIRDVTEGDLPLGIPVEAWGDPGAGGLITVPVEVALADLLFEPDGEEFVARLEAALSARRQGPGSNADQSARWEVRLQESQLVAIGTGVVVTAIVAAAEQGTYDVSIKVSHPLAATDAEWSQSVPVRSDPAAAAVLGKLVLQLDAEDLGQIGIVKPSEMSYESGKDIVIGVWVRGDAPSPASVSVQLLDAEGGAQVLNAAVRWAAGLAGPLVIEAQLPEVDAGDYRLSVDLGDGSESVSVPLSVGG